MKIPKQTAIIVLMAILLVVAVGYIAFDKYPGEKQQEQLTVYQQGIQVGYNQAVIHLIQQAKTCQQVPVSIANQTVNILAVDCLPGTYQEGVQIGREQALTELIQQAKTCQQVRVMVQNQNLTMIAVDCLG